MTTPSILGLSHVSLSVRHRAAARDFWVDVMGFDVVVDDADSCFVLDRGAGVAVILSDHDDQVVEGFDERRTGLDHLAFAVSDGACLLSWQQRLRRMGVPHSPITETDAGHHLNLRAPDDLPIELFVMKSQFATLLGVDVSTPVAATR
jgi:glyoxylase I family protein